MMIFIRSCSGKFILNFFTCGVVLNRCRKCSSDVTMKEVKLEIDPESFFFSIFYKMHHKLNDEIF